MIAVYKDLERKNSVEDKLGKLCQIGSMATYLSMFNKHTAQVDWNEASLIARFRGGLKDEILDSIATTESQPQRLQE